eukprot:490514-Rhodomonas_salina.3
MTYPYRPMTISVLAYDLVPRRVSVLTDAYGGSSSSSMRRRYPAASARLWMQCSPPALAAPPFMEAPLNVCHSWVSISNAHCKFCDSSHAILGGFSAILGGFSAVFAGFVQFTEAFGSFLEVAVPFTEAELTLDHVGGSRRAQRGPPPSSPPSPSPSA